MWFWFINFKRSFFCGWKGVNHSGALNIHKTISPLIFIFLKNMLFLFLQRKKRRGIRIFYDQEVQPFRIQDSDTKYHSVQYCYRPGSSSEVNKNYCSEFSLLTLNQWKSVHSNYIKFQYLLIFCLERNLLKRMFVTSCFEKLMECLKKTFSVELLR